MKSSFFLLLFITGLLSACNQQATKNELESTTTAVDSNDKLPQKDSAFKEEITAKDQEVLDSIKFAQMLQNALSISKKHLNANHFEQTILDSIPYLCGTFIKLGHLFSEENRHAIIRRENSGIVYIDIFLIEQDSLRPVLFHENAQMCYIGDTIQDVNGDNRNDFLVHWYPMSGCCLRDIFEVYCQTKEASFTQSTEFINPTFSPKERLVRGVTYGHPGQNSELYKIRWKGASIDTLEFISINPKDSTKYIKSKRGRYVTPENEQINIDKIPKEYRNIYAIDWFKGFI